MACQKQKCKECDDISNNYCLLVGTKEGKWTKTTALNLKTKTFSFKLLIRNNFIKFFPLWFEKSTDRQSKGFKKN